MGSYNAYSILIALRIRGIALALLCLNALHTYTFFPDARGERLPDWTLPEVGTSLNDQVSACPSILFEGWHTCSQGRLTSRSLAQRRSRDTDTDGKTRTALGSPIPAVCVRIDATCRLTRQEISELLDEDTRMWLVDPTVLEGVSNDLGAIVNCTRENDVILLRIEGEIQVPVRIVVPWNLTLSSYVTSTDLVDGIYPEADRKVRFKCPPRGGVFYIRCLKLKHLPVS